MIAPIESYSGCESPDRRTWLVSGSVVGNLFDVEAFLFREHTSVAAPDPTAPPVAGGAV
jgi:hypothetical protein